VDTDHYKRQLLAMEQQLSIRLERVGEQARKQEDDPVPHVGDEGVENQAKEQQFTQANANSTTLDEVREALKRIENGTFGKCLADGQVIEDKRLEAMPWTPYCLNHEQQLEGSPRRIPTL
jgi:DnaK suppressor protein